MAKFIDLLATSASVTVAEAAATGSPYAPKINGRLKKVRIVLGQTAAASLIEGGYVRLQSPSFGGVDSYFPFMGNGLHTAPSAQGVITEWDCDLQVKTGVNIAIFVKHDIVPVTPLLSIYGEFEG
jgi:hypothetical protein